MSNIFVTECKNIRKAHYENITFINSLKEVKKYIFKLNSSIGEINE